jgi:hypothetical protein
VYQNNLKTLKNINLKKQKKINFFLNIKTNIKYLISGDVFIKLVGA